MPALYVQVIWPIVGDALKVLIYGMYQIFRGREDEIINLLELIFMLRPEKHAVARVKPQQLAFLEVADALAEGREAAGRRRARDETHSGEWKRQEADRAARRQSRSPRRRTGRGSAPCPRRD